MPSLGYLRGRVAGRKQAVIGHYQNLSEAQRHQLIDQHAQGLAGARLAGYWRGAAEIDPANLPFTIKAAAQAAPGVADSRWVRLQRTDNAMSRINTRLQCYLVAFLAVLICTGIVVVAAVTREFRASSLLFYLVAAGYLYVNVWWMPRRALRADLAWTAMKAAPTPPRHDYAAAGRASALWTVAQLVCFIGGAVLVGWLVSPLTGPLK
ncbi:MAG: hypothetical protein ACR2KJ_01580 [Jatrophihabitans sp.]